MMSLRSEYGTETGPIRGTRVARHVQSDGAKQVDNAAAAAWTACAAALVRRLPAQAESHDDENRLAAYHAAVTALTGHPAVVVGIPPDLQPDCNSPTQD